jgi:U3 small nucleolar RNA-associated protein 23
MKLKRAKSNKKAMNIYKKIFNFRLPFQILLDGNFFKEASKMNSNLDISLAKILGGNVKIFTTSCIYKELKSLKLYHLLDNYKNYELKFCSHKNNTEISGSECIKSIIGEENKLKFAVATQDKQLRRELSKTPGVPLIYINRSVYILEPCSASSMEFLEKKEVEKLSKNVEQTCQNSSVQEKLQKKKRKEPNPLSVKKKEKRLDQQESTLDKKTIRKRRRKVFSENLGE